MTLSDKTQHVVDSNPNARFADGFEDALVGVGTQFNKSLAVYDYHKCIRILVERDGMSEENAKAFFEFNVAGSWVGENTPIFLERFEDMCHDPGETESRDPDGDERSGAADRDGGSDLLQE